MTEKKPLSEKELCEATQLSEENLKKVSGGEEVYDPNPNPHDWQYNGDTERVKENDEVLICVQCHTPINKGETYYEFEYEDNFDWYKLLHRSVHARCRTLENENFRAKF